MTSERGEAPTGNVALVTGASRGVVRGIALALLTSETAVELKPFDIPVISLADI